jgi:hypothetical protein
VVLLDLMPANHHQPDLFDTDGGRCQKLSPLIDRINDRYGRCSIGFGLFLSDVRAFKGTPRFTRCRRGVYRIRIFKFSPQIQCKVTV